MGFFAQQAYAVTLSWKCDLIWSLKHYVFFSHSQREFEFFVAVYAERLNMISAAK